MLVPSRVSHGEWAIECNLTIDQIRRILTRLGAAGLIVREQHLFKNRNVTFVRPSSACVRRLCEVREAQRSAQDARRDVAHVARSGTIQDAQECASLLKPFKNLEEETETATANAVAVPEAIERQKGIGTKETIAELEPIKPSIHSKHGIPTREQAIAMCDDEGLLERIIAAEEAAWVIRMADYEAKMVIWRAGLKARRCPVSGGPHE